MDSLVFADDEGGAGGGQGGRSRAARAKVRAAGTERRSTRPA